MTYQPKFQQCPYKTSDGKCVHKHLNIMKSKRKRFCGYKDVNKCLMYNEWVKLKNIGENGSNELTHIYEREGEDEKNR